MKKLLLFAMGAMMASPLLAQEEDVTSYIKNAGFDEDLTFQKDGTMKEKASQQSLSDRSWAFIAADSTVYARPKETSSQTRADGRKLEAVNGFAGRINGWKYIGADFPKCEWTYFGSVPYDLGETAVPIADDGTTYLLVPARPQNEEFEAGEGFVYLRAGWSGKAIYRQEVNLPPARYRLEYWTININPNTTSVATDLTQITCRREVFKDEEGTGLQNQEWTKHEFEFDATASFTMQFGYQAANAGSGGMPIVGLDGIKLYKIGEVDPEELINADLNAMADSLTEQSTIAEDNGLKGLAAEIYGYSQDLGDIIDDGTMAQKEAALKDVIEKLAYFKEAIAAAEKLDAIVLQLQTISDKYNFPGKNAFDEAVLRITNYFENGTSAQIFGAEEEAKNAIKAYVFSQNASAEAPANYTLLIQNPWFIKSNLEPTLNDGVAEYENAYTAGSSSDDFTSEGWYKSGEFTGGDQRLNFAQGRSCWNAWGSNITTIGIAQDLTDLPNGYYTVKGDLITQPDWVSDQHVYATSELGTFKSDALTSGDWTDSNDGIWSTLTAEKVLVTDGKLTIGAMGSGLGIGGSAGWFCATNFQLEYLGEAGADALKALLQSKLDAATAMVDTMHFAADKKALGDSIAKFNGSTDYAPAIAGMNAALDEAVKSEKKYAEYWMDGKTLPTLRDSLKTEGAYGAAKELVEFAYNYAMNWLKSDTASYKNIDAEVNLTKNYVNNYAPVFNEAAELAAKSSNQGKDYLNGIMNHQKEQLLAKMQDETVVNTYVSKLNAAIDLVEMQNIADDKDATDFTAFIINPNAEGTDGWNIEKGNGDGPIKSAGQWMDDSNSPYFDSWNGSGLSGHRVSQDIASLPNGTYTLGVYARTPNEGAYLFTKVDKDTVFVEIPLYTYTEIDSETQEEVEKVASDTHGPVWEEAKAKIDELSEEDDEYAYYYAIAQANGGIGRGWQHLEIKDLVVTDHKLTIGFLAGGEAFGTEKTFAGSWYSVNGFTLTRTAEGNNDGWAGPIADGIENVKNNAVALDGIYTLNGVRAAKLQRGLNIVIKNGKAMKVIVK